MQRSIELSDEQKKAYTQMKKEALMVLADEVYTTQTVLTQLMRLQQNRCRQSAFSFGGGPGAQEQSDR